MASATPIASTTNPQAINPKDMTYLLGQDGSISSVPSEYDEKTGENTIAMQAPLHGYQQVHPMVDPTDLDKQGNPTSYIIKPEEIQAALKHGLVPLEQYQLQKESKLAQNKLASGDTDFSAGAYNDVKHEATPGYQSDLGDTIDSKIGNALSLNSSPQVAGIYGAAKGLLSGSKDSLSDLYSSNKDAQQAVLNAQQAQHPIASDISSGLGTGALAIPEGELSLAKQLGINGALGGVSNANEAVNQNKSLPQVAQAGKEGFENSALGTALGIGAGKAIGDLGKFAGKVGGAFIPEDSPALFNAALSKNEDYGNKPFLQNVNNKLADTQEDMHNIFKGIQNKIGEQQKESLNSINPENLDQSKLFDSMMNARDKLISQMQVNQAPAFQKAAQAGLNELEGNLKTLVNNPKSVDLNQSIKRALQQPIYGDSGLRIPDNGVRRIIGAPASDAREVLEEASAPSAAQNLQNGIPTGYKKSSLGNINKGYQDIANAQNPKEVFEQHFLNPNDILELHKEGIMDPLVQKRWNNTLQLNEDLKNNPDLMPGTQEELQKFIDQAPDISRQAALARSNFKGVPGAVNRAANYLGLATRNFKQDISPATNYLAPHISPIIQKLMEVSPSFRAQMAAAGMGIGSQMNGNNQQ